MKNIIYIMILLLISYSVQAKIISTNECPIVNSLNITPLKAMNNITQRYDWIGYDNYRRKMESFSLPEMAPDTDQPTHQTAMITNQISSSGYGWYAYCEYKDANNAKGGLIYNMVDGACHLNRVDAQPDEYITYCYPDRGPCQLICTD